MRIFLITPLLLVLSGPALAGDGTEALLDALAIDEVAAIMGEEGLGYGRQLEEDLFPGRGGAAWAREVADIYAPDRFLPEFRKVFGRTLAADGGDVAAMTAFFTSDTGRKTVALELSARRALLDDSVAEASKLKVEEMRAEDDPRLAAVEAFIEAGDLIEANVSSGLNASLSFYRGLAEAGAVPGGMAEDELLASVWSQEADIRSESTDWLYSYLTMAYAPLSDEELRAYIAFSASEAGQDLNRALLAGFDAAFQSISRDLGKAAGARIAGQDL